MKKTKRRRLSRREICRRLDILGQQDILTVRRIIELAKDYDQKDRRSKERRNAIRKEIENARGMTKYVMDLVNELAKETGYTLLITPPQPAKGQFEKIEAEKKA